MNITEYKDNIDALKMIDSIEVYRWMISLGEKLQDDPLSEERRTDAIELIDANLVCLLIKKMDDLKHGAML